MFHILFLGMHWCRVQKTYFYYFKLGSCRVSVWLSTILCFNRNKIFQKYSWNYECVKYFRLNFTLFLVSSVLFIFYFFLLKNRKFHLFYFYFCCCLKLTLTKIYYAKFLKMFKVCVVSKLFAWHEKTVSSTKHNLLTYKQ